MPNVAKFAAVAGLAMIVTGCSWLGNWYSPNQSNGVPSNITTSRPSTTTPAIANRDKPCPTIESPEIDIIPYAACFAEGKGIFAHPGSLPRIFEMRSGVKISTSFPSEVCYPGKTSLESNVLQTKPWAHLCYVTGDGITSQPITPNGPSLYQLGENISALSQASVTIPHTVNGYNVGCVVYDLSNLVQAYILRNFNTICGEIEGIPSEECPSIRNNDLSFKHLPSLGSFGLLRNKSTGRWSIFPKPAHASKFAERYMTLNYLLAQLSSKHSSKITWRECSSSFSFAKRVVEEKFPGYRFTGETDYALAMLKQASTIQVAAKKPGEEPGKGLEARLVSAPEPPFEAQIVAKAGPKLTRGNGIGYGAKTVVDPAQVVIVPPPKHLEPLEEIASVLNITVLTPDSVPPLVVPYQLPIKTLTQPPQKVKLPEPVETESSLLSYAGTGDQVIKTEGGPTIIFFKPPKPTPPKKAGLKFEESIAPDGTIIRIYPPPPQA